MNLYLRKTIDYAAGNFFNKLLLIILLPIFTHFLAPEEYAVYANLMIFFSIASLIYLLGIQQALFSHFYEVKTASYQFTLIYSVYIVLSLFGLLMTGCIVLFRQELSQLMLRTASYAYLFNYLAIILFFNMLFCISLGFLNIMEKSRSYAVISALQNLIVLLLVILFSLYSRFSLAHYFLFLAVASVLASAAALGRIVKVLAGKQVALGERRYFSLPIITSLLRFGIVMIPGTIAMLILQASDRYMLTYLSPNSLYDVGIYSAGYRIGMIMHFLVTMISLVYLPYAMKTAAEPQSQKNNRHMFRYYIIFGSVFGAMIISYSQEFFRFIISSNYLESHKIVFAGVISSFLYGIFNIININFYARKKAGNITLAVLLGSVLNIALNFLFIPGMGIYGAGLTSIISYFVIVVFNYCTADYLYQIKYQFYLVFPALALLAFASYFNASYEFNWNLFFGKTAVFLCLLAVFFLLLQKDKNLQNLMKKLKNQRSEDEIQS